MITNPNTPEFENELREIYRRCDVSNNQITDAIGFEEFSQSLKQSLRLMMEEVIGEDDTPMTLGMAGVTYREGGELPIPKPVKWRNKLKAEQRQRLDQALTKYFGEE